MQIDHDRFIQDSECLEKVFSYAPTAPSRPYTYTEIRDSWVQFIKDTRSPRLSLYIHIPFCAHRCRYCSYFSTEVTAPAELEKYREYLFALIDFFSPVFKDRLFEHVYIGGGTPTIFPEHMFKELLEKIFSSFSFTRNSTRSCEINPITSTPHKLSLLEQFGFNYISFGVQTFTPHALKKANRAYQDRRLLKDFVAQLHAKHFNAVNADLLYGLVGDTPQGFLESVKAVIALGIPKVTVIRLVPTAEYLNVHFGGDQGKCIEHLNSFAEKMLPSARALFQGNGYIDHKCMSSSAEDHTYAWIKPTESSPGAPGYFSDCSLLYAYSDIPSQDLSVLGLGPTARSHIFCRLDYQALQAAELPFAPAHAAFKGNEVGPRTAMLRTMCIAFKERGRIDRNGFKELYARDIVDVFGPRLAALQREGLIKVSDKEIELLPKNNQQKFHTLLRLMGDTVRIVPTIDLKLTAQGKDIFLHAELERKDQRYIARREGYGMFLPAGTSADPRSTGLAKLVFLRILPLLKKHSAWPDRAPFNTALKKIFTHFAAQGISVVRGRP